MEFWCLGVVGCSQIFSQLKREVLGAPHFSRRKP